MRILVPKAITNTRCAILGLDSVQKNEGPWEG